MCQVGASGSLSLDPKSRFKAGKDFFAAVMKFFKTLFFVFLFLKLIFENHPIFSLVFFEKSLFKKMFSFPTKKVETTRQKKTDKFFLIHVVLPF